MKFESASFLKLGVTINSTNPKAVSICHPIRVKLLSALYKGTLNGGFNALAQTEISKLDILSFTFI